MIVKLLTEHHLEFLSLKEGCTGSSKSTLFKMSNCLKSQTLAQINYENLHYLELEELQSLCQQSLVQGR